MFDREFLGIIGGALLVAALFIFVPAAILGRASDRGRLVAIEQVRQAAATVDIRESEDVMGQVLDANKSIARAKYYNARWWADWFVIDEWDTVPEIEVPRR